MDYFIILYAVATYRFPGVIWSTIGQYAWLLKNTF